MGVDEDGFKIINSITETFSPVVVASSHVGSLPVSSAFLLIVRHAFGGCFLGCVDNVAFLQLLKVVKS